MKITKKIINDIFEKIIFQHTFKCLHKAKYVISSFENIAKEYGFELDINDNKKDRGWQTQQSCVQMQMPYPEIMLTTTIRRNHEKINSNTFKQLSETH